MNVLITGANGFVGTALRQRLARESQWNVRACARTPPATAADDVEWATCGDLAAETDWSPLLHGMDVVVHLAARVHVMNADASDDTLYQRANVQGTRRLAEQAVNARVRRFVFLSSVKVHGESGHLTEDSPMAPADAYGVSKRDAENALREVAGRTGLEVVIIRSPLVYGPGVKANFHALMMAVRNGRALPLASVANRRSLVGVDNLADMIASCTASPAAASQAFLVSDGDDVSTPDLVRRLASVMDRPARLIPVPVWALRAAAALTGRLPAVNRLTGSLTVDISKARRLLAWSPPVTLEEGLRRAVGAR
jgi:UDP-4-keto-D-QuiNAc 4-reductase